MSSAHMRVVSGESSVLGDILRTIQSQHTDLWGKICAQARPQVPHMIGTAMSLTNYVMGRKHHQDGRRPWNASAIKVNADSAAWQVENSCADWCDDFLVHLKTGESPEAKEEREKQEKEATEAEKRRKRDETERQIRQALETKKREEDELAAITFEAERKQLVDGADW